MKGEATGSYFESGTGKEGDPYIIANAKQLYYFNWLQDLGYFNEVDETAKEIPTTYFKIKDGVTEMDAGNYILPPAGTSENPFVGNFDGNGCVVKNLTISNSWEELKSTKPAQAKQNGNILESSEIVGFFGIVGKYTTDIYYETSANAVKDLYFDNLTVKSAATNVLAGFIAGYANGTIDNCGIYCGQFSFVNEAKGLTDGKSISEYALIGDYGSEFTWTNKPAASGSSSGAGSEWGGSVDFRTLARRINYMFSEMYKSTSAPTGNGYSVGYSSNDFNLYSRVYFAGSPSSYQYNYESVTVNYAYASLNAGTYLPINVDMGLFDENGNETSDTSTSYGTPKWNMGGNYEGATSEKVASGNPGFIVGGGSSSSSGSTRIRISKYSSTGSGMNGTIKNSITALDSSNNATDAGIRLLTYVNSSDSFKFISDEYNNLSTSATINGYSVDTASNIGLANYAKSRSHFKDFLVRDNVVYGLYVNGALGLGSYSLSAKLSETETNYQLVNNGINFKAKEAGVITMIAGVYTAANSIQYMPNVIKLERNSDGSITGYTKIDSIYENTYSNGSTTYSINNAESGASSSKQVYAKTWYDNKSSATAGLPMNYAIYQEIPVPAGDYVVGNGDSNVNMATILYLDIGANGSESQKQDAEIKASNIDFVYKENGALAKITDEGYTPSGVVFSIGGPSTSAGLIYFKRETKNNKDEGGVVYVGVAYYTATGCSITPAGNGKSTNKEPDED